jgi:hypothetical protein
MTSEAAYGVEYNILGQKFGDSHSLLLVIFNLSTFLFFLLVPEETFDSFTESGVSNK